MPQDAEPEHERRQDPAPAGPRVERHARPDRVHVDPGDAGIRPAVPLPQRQIGDLVSVCGEPLGQAPVPPLGAADRVREQAVIDDADAHAAAKVARLCASDRSATSATFAVARPFHR